MKNPFFQNKTQDAIQAAAERNLAIATGALGKAQAPMIGGAAGSMLKGMGIDPAAVSEMAETIIGTLQAADARMARMEENQKRILALLEAQSEIIGLNADVVRAVQAEAGGAS